MVVTKQRSEAQMQSVLQYIVQYNEDFTLHYSVQSVLKLHVLVLHFIKSLRLQPRIKRHKNA